MRQVLISQIILLEKKHAYYLAIVPAQERHLIQEQTKKFINHWIDIRHWYLSALTKLQSIELSPPDYLRSLSHTIWFSKLYGLRAFFPNADAMDLYNDGSEQFFRPIL